MIRKNPKEILEIKNSATEMNSYLMSLLVHWTQLQKDSLSLRIFQQKHPNLKSKGKKDWKKQHRLSKNSETATKYVTLI